MPWRYIEKTNLYDQPQVFDCGESPNEAVCKSCHQPYVNAGDGLECSDCTGVHDIDGFAQIERDSFVEETNEHGFPQMYQIDHATLKRYPVCSCCYGAVMPNRGEGTACPTCQHAFELECQHDYDNGDL